MDHHDAPKPLHELMQGGTTLMVGTGRDGDLEFRPMTVARVDGDTIDMLLDSNEQWVIALANGDVAHVTMSDERDNRWVSLRGTVTLSTDQALIDELWNPAAGAFFDDGRQTPGIAVLRITGDRGRYWASPSGRLGSLVAMARAKLGDPEDSGTHGDIAL